MISNAAFDVFDMKHNVNRYVVNCITSYTEKSFRRHLQLDPHEIMELWSLCVAWLVFHRKFKGLPSFRRAYTAKLTVILISVGTQPKFYNS